MGVLNLSQQKINRIDGPATLQLKAYLQTTNIQHIIQVLGSSLTCCYGQKDDRHAFEGGVIYISSLCHEMNCHNILKILLMFVIV